jgi:hypothetical protein
MCSDTLQVSSIVLYSDGYQFDSDGWLVKVYHFLNKKQDTWSRPAFLLSWEIRWRCNYAVLYNYLSLKIASQVSTEQYLRSYFWFLGNVYILIVTMKVGWIILIVINVLVALFATPYIVILWMLELSVLAFYLSQSYEKRKLG